jgi:dipeptidase D
MDMVCQKDADCPINMDTDGLDVTHDGKFVFANGTTLGADDGIAVAYAMAILASKNIPHPPLEVIITVDEETGMFGAAGIDLSVLKGNTMLNLDSDAEGVFTVSCAGGCRATIKLPVQRRAVYGPCVKLIVGGLQGGHSGVEIHKNLANANKVMGEFLSRVEKLMPLCITKIVGGDKDNAIPRTCEVTLVAMGTNIDRINGVAEQLQKEIREQYDEPEAVIYGEDVDALGGNALTTGDSSKVIGLLCAAPNGVDTMSQDIPGLVQTSLNLGVARLEEELRLTFAVRSSVGTEKRALLDRLAELAKFYDAEYSEVGDYPAWEYRKDSKLRQTMIEVYERMYGKSPKVVAIHAGLECGLLAEKIPNLDCVAMGPTAYDIHTSRERLDIASTRRVWEYILELLKSL